jgi:hypothetical protein
MHLVKYSRPLLKAVIRIHIKGVGGDEECALRSLERCHANLEKSIARQDRGRRQARMLSL